MVSPRRSSGPSKHSSSSLAEDILAIRAALEGASPSARERTLKTLERLTARLALAESERDMALGNILKKFEFSRQNHVFFFNESFVKIKSLMLETSAVCLLFCQLFVYNLAAVCLLLSAACL